MGQVDTQSQSRLKLYADLMSQPSRACYIFCKLNDLPVDYSPILIHKGETRKEPYTRLNPLSKVPLLEDAAPPGGSAPLLLPESAAIIPYLASRFGPMVPEHWCPRKCMVQRARVDSALHWYQGNIRAGAMRLVFNKVVAQRLGVPPNLAVAEEGMQLLQTALGQMEKVWLAGGTRRFMTGDSICAADLLCACELEQLRMLHAPTHGSSLETVLAPYPAVRSWMADVRQACMPYYDEAHKVLAAAAAQRPKPAAKL